MPRSCQRDGGGPKHAVLGGVRNPGQWDVVGGSGPHGGLCGSSAHLPWVLSPGAGGGGAVGKAGALTSPWPLRYSPGVLQTLCGTAEVSPWRPAALSPAIPLLPALASFRAGSDSLAGASLSLCIWCPAPLLAFFPPWSLPHFSHPRDLPSLRSTWALVFLTCDHPPSQPQEMPSRFLPCLAHLLGGLPGGHRKLGRRLGAAGEAGAGRRWRAGCSRPGQAACSIAWGSWLLPPPAVPSRCRWPDATSTGCLGCREKTAKSRYRLAGLQCHAPETC